MNGFILNYNWFPESPILITMDMEVLQLFTSKHLLESSCATSVLSPYFPSSRRAWNIEVFLTKRKPNIASYPDVFCFILRLQYTTWWSIYATYSQAVCNPDCNIPQILSPIRRVKLRYLASRSASLFHLWTVFAMTVLQSSLLLHSSTSEILNYFIWQTLLKTISKEIKLLL